MKKTCIAPVIGMQSNNSKKHTSLLYSAVALTAAGIAYGVVYAYQLLRNAHPKDTPRAASCRQFLSSKVRKKYTVGELLGEGSFACVYAASNKSESQTMNYAIKVIPRQFIIGDGHVHQFSAEYLESELSILKRCKHPNILSLVDSQWTNDALLFVTERAYGGVLFDKIVEIHHYDESVAKQILRQILEAVQYLHDVAAVIHRDLKPENILLMDDGDDCTSVRICDFGVSKMWTKTTEKLPTTTNSSKKDQRNRKDNLKKQSLRTSTVTGTPGYQAPEMQDSSCEYGTEVDIWSVGMILHAMLSGSLPLSATPTFSLEDDVWNNVSDDSQQLITNMLQEDPQERCTATAALKSKWMQNNAIRTKPSTLWTLVRTNLKDAKSCKKSQN